MFNPFDDSATEYDTMPDAAEFRQRFDAGGVEGCKQFMKDKLEEWKTVPLTIGVIGNSGAGKSSFINAVRRLTADDEGAAAVGETETTMDIQVYCHPNNEKLQFHDLPGVGTTNFPKENYLEIIKVDQFDFFLLVTSTRFTENDTWLGNEITRRNKKFFFVRTKIGADVSNNRRAHPRTHNEDAVFSKIFESTHQHLEEQGAGDVPVFLIDSYKPQKYDFDKLEQSLIRDFPDLKRAAMIFSLCAFSEQMIITKAKVLRSRIWKVAAASGAVALIPIPGVSMMCDLAAVIAETTFYFQQLGLDEKSLEHQAKLTSTDVNKLKEIVGSHFGAGVLKNISVETVKMLLEQLPKGAVTVSGSVVEEFARFIPFVGSVIAAGISFAGTYYILKCILDKMESVALEVVRFTVSNQAIVEQLAGDEEED